MGHVPSKEKSRLEAFNLLHPDNKGTLTLPSLLTLQHVKGITHPITGSPLLLYRFDESKEGNINFKEFKKLIESITEAEKRISKIKRKRKKKKVAENSKGLFVTSVDCNTGNITIYRLLTIS
eukprot:TRINITY_DN3916_c0_g1_i2.p1 TRINITY_DN3916_c0_g1~~TRINITY_DN3916_c0_g1_i2.p1  ORF type:complete len:122 (+),score=23.91 TRINITY_DN3916_c0_g1_i2:51-416(+)